MAIKSWIKSIAIVACIFGLVSPAMAKEIEVKTAWVPGQEGFPIWFAKKQGWDKAEGFTIQMKAYPSGQESLMDFTVNNWVIGGLGAIPTVEAAKNGNAVVIGIANDESRANVVMARPGSPILAKKGLLESYPEVYGTAVDLRKKTILVTKNSSAHFTMEKYLERLGVTDKEVVIKNLDQALALLSFEHAKGDLAVFWAPFSFMGKGKGWVTVCTARDLDVRVPMYIVANKAFTEQYPDITKKYLTLYMRGVHWVLNSPREEVVKQMQTYFKEVFNLDYSETMVDLNFNVFELFNLAQQKELFAEENGMSEVKKWQESITNFVLANNVIHKSEEKNVIDNNYINPTFMNMIKEEDLK